MTLTFSDLAFNGLSEKHCFVWKLHGRTASPSLLKIRTYTEYVYICIYIYIKNMLGCSS